MSRLLCSMMGLIVLTTGSETHGRAETCSSAAGFGCLRKTAGLPPHSHSNINTLGWLLGDADVFRKHHFGRVWHHYEHDPEHGADKLSHLWSLPLAAHYVEQSERGNAKPLQHGVDYKIVINGSDLDGGGGPPQKLSWDYMQDALARGGTWVWIKAQHWHGNLYQFCSELERSLNGMWVGANVYMTPAGSRGFDPHYDSHDTFILQAEGHKHWHVCRRDSPDYVAIHAEKKDRRKAGRSKSAAERRYTNFFSHEELHAAAELETKSKFGCTLVHLKPGDVLYLPAGTIHEAAAPSLSSSAGNGGGSSDNDNIDSSDGSSGMKERWKGVKGLDGDAEYDDDGNGHLNGDDGGSQHSTHITVSIERKEHMYFTLLTELAGTSNTVTVKEKHAQQKNAAATTLKYADIISTIAAKVPQWHATLPRMHEFARSIDNEDLPAGLLSGWKAEAASMVASLDGGGGGGGSGASFGPAAAAVAAVKKGLGEILKSEQAWNRALNNMRLRVVLGTLPRSSTAIPRLVPRPYIRQGEGEEADGGAQSLHSKERYRRGRDVWFALVDMGEPSQVGSAVNGNRGTLPSAMLPAIRFVMGMFDSTASMGRPFTVAEVANTLAEPESKEQVLYLLADLLRKAAIEPA